MPCYGTCCRPDPEEWDTSVVLSRRIVKATRKPHECWYCGHEIPTSSPCQTAAELYDGRVSTLYRHYPACPLRKEVRTNAMYVGMGRGGPFTALFGLFVFVILLLLEALKWLGVAVVIIIVLAGRGIRYLYRHHRAKKELRDHPHGPDLSGAPRPYVSPVEYRTRDRG